MENRYTLTIYVAAPGTPTLKGGEKDTSTVGHVYYSISDGNRQMGWGFAPTSSFPIWKGKVVNNEFNIYQNPVLERTMEITKKQYDALKDFGLHPDKHGFNSSFYNAFSNSCVDFLYTALKEGDIYHKQVYGNDITGLVDHEGAIRVPRNIKELKDISNPIPHSPLNKTIERPLPKQSWSQKNILSKTDDILPSIKNIEDVPQYTQAASSSKPQFLSPEAQKIFNTAMVHLTTYHKTNNLSINEEKLQNSAMALTALAQSKNRTDLTLFSVKNDQYLIGNRNPTLNLASMDIGLSASIPAEKSFNQIQQTAQLSEYEEQQKQLAQSQSRGMSIG